MYTSEVKKVLSFGKVGYLHHWRRDCPVTVGICLRETDNGPEFSASGEIWNHAMTDIYCGGQCLDAISEYVDDPLFKRVYRLWKLYHLNGMNAGTPEQDAAVKKWIEEGNRYEYHTVCDYLKSIGLYEVEHNGKPYKYGHGWLYREIPAADLAEIEHLLRSE